VPIGSYREGKYPNLLKQESGRKCTKAITHRTVIGGHLDVVQEYLVYKFFTGECRKQTGYITLIDAGNGNGLYTS